MAPSFIRKHSSLIVYSVCVKLIMLACQRRIRESTSLIKIRWIPFEERLLNHAS